MSLISPFLLMGVTVRFYPGMLEELFSIRILTGRRCLNMLEFCYVLGTFDAFKKFMEVRGLFSIILSPCCRIGKYVAPPLVPRTRVL